MTDDAIEAHDLVKVFGKNRSVRALDGLSMTSPSGAVLGVLGPNGAGKTTAVRILSTILTPDKGHAAILGHDVVREAETVRRLIGLAGQYATVDENLTGRENLRMVGRLTHMGRRETRLRADELLEQFGLAHAAHRPLKTYSGGMRRRLDLAAALVGRPPVLFLDEPTTGLDPTGRQDLWQTIEELVRVGTSVLLTTQYLEEADRLAQHIVVVDHGQVIAEGTSAELKAGLGTTVIAVTLPDTVTAQRAADLVRHLVAREPSVDGSAVELTVEEGPRLAAEVLRTLDQARVPVAGLALREPSLDDVFLTLTGHRAEQHPPAGDHSEDPSGQASAGGQDTPREEAPDGRLAGVGRPQGEGQDR
jgi:ABC-2 type transport system ATP-binding protein